MTNASLFKSMIERYERASFAKSYILGFAYKGNIYMARTDASVFPYVMTLDLASRGAGCSIRFCPTNDQKLFLLSRSTILCSEKFFNETCASSIYNRGDIFEKLVTEFHGQTWEKDNVPFTEAGDIEINGIAYQIKYQKATLASEKTLERLGI
jgi:hypothetical protein